MAQIREATSYYQMVASGADVINTFLRGLVNDELIELMGKPWCDGASILSKGTAAQTAESIQALRPRRETPKLWSVLDVTLDVLMLLAASLLDVAQAIRSYK